MPPPAPTKQSISFYDPTPATATTDALAADRHYSGGLHVAHNLVIAGVRYGVWGSSVGHYPSDSRAE